MQRGKTAKLAIVSLFLNAGAARAELCDDLRYEFFRQVDSRPIGLSCDLDLYTGRTSECIAYFERQNAALQKLNDANCPKIGQHTWDEAISLNLYAISTMRKYPEGAVKGMLDEADRARQATIDSLEVGKRNKRDEREAREAKERAARDAKAK